MRNMHNIMIHAVCVGKRLVEIITTCYRAEGTGTRFKCTTTSFSRPAPQTNDREGGRRPDVGSPKRT